MNEGPRHHRLLIGGDFVESISGKTFETHDPSTGEVVATVAEAQPEDVDRAILAAREAFDEGPWPTMSPSARGKAMRRVLELMLRRQNELTDLEVADAGHTVRMASLFTVPYANEYWRHLTKLGERFGYHEPVEPFGFPARAWDFVWREPYGVCAGIIPWNYPYLMAIWKLAPALITGNTAVLKPATETPVTAMALAELIAEADLPPGVVNVVPGHGPTAGEALVTHPAVDKVAFTGSTEVGKRVMQLASVTLKKTTLELGGKSPGIILDDADLDVAVRGALWGLYLHSGQTCEAGSRLFVPSALYDDAVALAVELVEGMKVGDAHDFSSDLGPLVSRRQLETVDRYVQIGQEEGAKLLTGGHRLTDEGRHRGWFYAPTIFGDVDNSMRIAQEEIFGPVLAVIRYDDVEQAVRMANDSIYGLTAGVWSRDAQRALGVARRLKAGTVWINDWHMLSPAAPFGGYKQSGVGREFGSWGLQEYLETKYVRVDQMPTREQKFWFQVIGL